MVNLNLCMILVVLVRVWNPSILTSKFASDSILSLSCIESLMIRVFFSWSLTIDFWELANTWKRETVQKEYLFDRSLRDVFVDGYRSCLSHSHHSSDSLFFNCRVPLRFDDVDLVCFCECKAEEVSVYWYGWMRFKEITYPTAPVLMDIKRTLTSGSWRNVEINSVRPSRGLRPSTCTNRMPSNVSIDARMSKVSLQLDNTTLSVCQRSRVT